MRFDGPLANLSPVNRGIAGLNPPATIVTCARWPGHLLRLAARPGSASLDNLADPTGAASFDVPGTCGWTAGRLGRSRLFEIEISGYIAARDGRGTGG